MVMAYKYFSLRKVNFSKCGQSIFSGARLPQSQEQWLFHVPSDEHRVDAVLCSRARASCRSSALVLALYCGTAWWASLTGLAQTVPPQGSVPRPRQSSLCTLYCKDLSFSCISLNKISHYIWWIISNSSSAALDLHEFILSGEIKKQFIQFLALLGDVIIQPCNSVCIARLWLFIMWNDDSHFIRQSFPDPKIF